jgi:hypothetical protein
MQCKMEYATGKNIPRVDVSPKASRREKRTETLDTHQL